MRTPSRCAPARATAGGEQVAVRRRARSRGRAGPGSTRPGADVGGAERVGDARDDLEAGPQPGRARAGEGVQAEVEHLLARCRGRTPACAGWRAATRTRSGSSRTCSSGRRPRRRARRRCARRRRSCRGAARRPRGRGPAPCRTTCRARRRTWRRAGCRASWLPHAEVAPSSSLRPGTWWTRCSLEQLAVARELLVEAAERGALVAGDHRPGGQAAAAVGAVLVEHQAHERLDAGEEDPALLEDVLVVEADLALGAAPRRPLPAALTRVWPAVGRAPGRRANVVSLVIGELNLPLVVPGSQYRHTACRRAIAGIRSRTMTIATRSLPAQRATLADDDHEQIVIRQDPRTGLRFIVAVHSTVLGPALGGLRLKSYPGGLQGGARGRDGPGAHDDPEGLGRRARPRRRQGRDDRRRRRLARGSRASRAPPR